MSKTAFEVNHPLAVKVWSKKLHAEAYRKTFIGMFIGESEDSLIMEKTDLKKSAGDKITCGLNIQLQGDGVEGDATLEGNEEALQFFDDSLFVNQLRHASRVKGKMTEQRVPYNLRATSNGRLADWWARRLDTWFFNQVCGNTAQTDLRYTGHNATTAPTANRHIWQAGRANDESLTSADVFSLDLVDVAKERARTASTEDNTGPMVRPIMHQGEEMYVMFLHDYQESALRAQNSQWEALQRAALQGGDVKGNPIFNGSLGIYNNVILHRASRVTNGVSSADGTSVANTKRAVLCGAQAATIAFGSDNGADSFNWVEESFDYGNQFGVSAGCIGGMKKSKFVPEDDATTNAEDFGTVVVSTYAAPASTA